MKYAYSFSLWPDETRGFDRALFDAFRLLAGRVEMVFTEAGFVKFRHRLAADGFTLRCITRVPYNEPETVP